MSTEQTANIYDNPTIWRNDTVDLTAFIGQDLQIAFRNVNGYGNNLYIDNIQLGDQSVGLEEHDLTNISVYPNPVQSGGLVSFEGINGEFILRINSSDGKEIFVGKLQPNEQIRIPREISAGMYYYAVESNTQRFYGEVLVFE